MERDLARARLLECIRTAYRQCWGDELPSRTLPRDEDSAPDDPLTNDELRLIALADLAIPFEDSLLENDDVIVGDFTLAEITERAASPALRPRRRSVGCVIAFEGFSPITFSIREEWSTWIGYCLRAHSPELRATLPHLAEAAGAIAEYASRPRRTIREVDSDGAVIISAVPMSFGDDSGTFRKLMRDCEVVAAHVDAFRRIEECFPELRLDAGISVGDVWLQLPFSRLLWPFGDRTRRYVAEICGRIRSLTADVDDDDVGRPAPSTLPPLIPDLRPTVRVQPAIT
jgi:hypothetical protein